MTQLITAARLDEIIAAFNNHDADAVVSFFAPEGVMLSPAGKEDVGTTLRGRDTIRAALAKRFADSPDIQWTEGKNWIIGNKALSEWRVRGTAPGGANIDIVGCDLWEFEDGLIVKKDTYYKQKT
ncbi:nuclear transport factor 2 family protein [Pseudomonas sp. NBRC 111137]|uniref:nuclear transport factor 2 family protein n=1 Tax=Pseudomonas sp. NBRC 111137 TaxID=1661052 RepID=UPI0006D40927|nr:nuclear transport factor 2 family protein [Pseudomonas sp. NBRC 111137]